ncbi:MAG: HAD family phosphatase [Pseudomonadota bacterium]
MNLKSCSAVVFDVGNVLITWDPHHLYRKVFDGDDKRMTWFLANITTPAWNIEQDRGRSFADGVAALVAQHLEWAAEIRAFDTRWHEMIPGAVDKNVRILDHLRTNDVPVYAITNFSCEKWAACCERFPFLTQFNGTVVSAHERVLKPDPVIFQTLCERYNLDPQDCLFIDDSQANVATAQNLGMAAMHATPEADIRTEFMSLGFDMLT